MQILCDKCRKEETKQIPPECYLSKYEWERMKSNGGYSNFENIRKSDFTAHCGYREIPSPPVSE